MGSANATKAAIVDGRNVELLVELTGKTSKVGGIDNIFSAEGFGKLLEPYQPGEPPAEDSAVQLAKMRLETAKAVLAAAELRISCGGDGDQRKLTLKPGGPFPLEGIESLKAWPVSLRPEFTRTDVMQIQPWREEAAAASSVRWPPSPCLHRL